jgi:hypothetical protein
MKKSRKRPKLANARKKQKGSATATGAKLAALAGRPSKQAVTAAFGKAGYGLSWLARAERLGIKPERLCAKFKANPEAVKSDWAALSVKK